MPSPYESYNRDGLNKLIKLARAMCIIVTTFAAIIEAKYNDKPNIIALLNAIKAVCLLLPDAQNEFDAIPSDDPAFPIVSSEIAGINPDAIAPPDEPV